jgi:DNA polymerase-1
MQNINILIDGSNLCYRNFFAMKELANSKGRPTGLLYGFIKTVQRLKRKYKPNKIIVVWDSKPKARREIYPEYKAHREKTRTEEHELMFNQIDDLKETLKIFNIGQVYVDGQEADDIIASLIKNNFKDDLNYFYSTDLDLAQLVENKKTLWLRPEKNGEESILNEEAVEYRFDVHPKKLVFFKALTGDSSDNIKGIPYFPKKTAKLICNTFDSIEDIRNKTLPKIKLSPKQCEKFAHFIIEEEGKPSLTLNYKLVQLDSNIKIDKVEIPEYNRKEVEKLLEECEFTTLLVTINKFNAIFESKPIPTGPMQISLF